MKRLLSFLAIAVVAVGAAVLIFKAAVPTPAESAQHSSANGSVGYLTPPQAAAFGRQVEQSLAAKAVAAAIVFRSAQPRDKLPDGIAYTHGAFWIARGAGQGGYAVYNLYHGDGDNLPVTRSQLKQDRPVDFMLGSAIDEAAVIVPTPDVQRKLLAVIGSPAYGAMHNDRYSLIANPLSDKYQNCNGFMLNVLAAAITGTTQLSAVRGYVKRTFQPSEIKVGGFKRLAAPLADRRIKTDDQRGGPLRTATYESLAAWMRGQGALDASYVVTRQR